MIHIYIHIDCILYIKIHIIILKVSHLALMRTRLTQEIFILVCSRPVCSLQFGCVNPLRVRTAVLNTSVLQIETDALDAHRP